MIRQSLAKVALLVCMYMVTASLMPEVSLAICPCPGMSHTPKKLSFGGVKEKAKKELFETLTALENVKVNITKVIPLEEDYKIGTTNSCIGQSIAKGNSCKVEVVFIPPEPGKEYLATLEVGYESEASLCTLTESINLEGQGTK